MVVRLDRGLVSESLAKAPREITMHATDSEHDMPMHGRHVVFAQTSGPPNIMDTARGRRAGTFEDFTNIVKLCQSYEVIHVLGGGVEPQDVPGACAPPRDDARDNDAERQGPEGIRARAGPERGQF